VSDPGATASEGEDALRALDRSWDDAWRSSQGRTIFQSSDWCWSWLATVGRHVEPIVLRTANRSGSLVGIALQRDPSTSTVGPLSSPWGDYHDTVGAVDDLACATLADALTHVADDGARIELNEVRPGSALAHIATRAGLRPSPGSITHAIDLRNSATVGRIVDRREHRTKMRRMQRPRHGFHRLDLLRGDHHYKTRFADLTTTSVTFTTHPAPSNNHPGTAVAPSAKQPACPTAPCDL
jgi:CelD/BcsL family acetyltransferase involved in cellulose biosynthesis